MTITSDVFFLFKPKIPQAIDYIRRKRKRPKRNFIYEHLGETEASNLDTEAIDDNVSEFITQDILENRNHHTVTFLLKSGKRKGDLRRNDISW